MSSSPVEFSIAPQGRDPYSERRPPYSEDAEQAVLAAMLMDADAIMRAAEYVNDTMNEDISAVRVDKQEVERILTLFS